MAPDTPPPMDCPTCGIRMNRHAEKLILADDDEGVESQLGGIIEETHSCPGCGDSATRRV